jgi:2-dehydropantoate 2-reductase
MRIAVVGAGGQGGALGGLLASSGADVHLIDRGAHLAAIRERGLTLRPDRGDPITVRVPATDDPASVGACDYVLVCVKTYDLDEAVAQAGPLIGPRTALLTVQNGIDAPGAVARAFGADRVIAGVSYVAAGIEGPGVVACGGVTNRIALGMLTGSTDDRADGLGAALRSAGIDAEVTGRILEVMWEKLVLVSATGGVMALLRLSWGPVLDSRVGWALAQGVMEETEHVGRACGAALPAGTAERVFRFARASIERSTRSSMLQDLVHGRRLELDALNGTVVRLGSEVGVPTPLNSTICLGLEPYVDGAPKRQTR